DGPYQYEAAARASQAIAAKYPRNSWLIVSPSQELPFTYGRGWHLELKEFVSRFSAASVADPAFRLPYPVAHTFFFVEKRPLWPEQNEARLASARIDQILDPMSRDYVLPLGRAALEFEAAALLAAYCGSHSDMELVYTDDSLTILRVGRAPQG